jgi:hypothetical protein
MDSPELNFFSDSDGDPTFGSSSPCAAAYMLMEPHAGTAFHSRQLVSVVSTSQSWSPVSHRAIRMNARNWKGVANVRSSGRRVTATTSVYYR